MGQTQTARQHPKCPCHSREVTVSVYKSDPSMLKHAAQHMATKQLQGVMRTAALLRASWTTGLAPRPSSEKESPNITNVALAPVNNEHAATTSKIDLSKEERAMTTIQ